MAALILDGNKVAAEIRAEVAGEVKTMAAAGIRPGLAVVLAGHNPASEIYVRGKVKSCEECGMHSEKLTPPDTVTTEELLELIGSLNRRDDIDGILVQLPLPSQVDSKKVLMAVDPAKDVDGFHPMNVGFLSTQRPGLVPCTPAGIIEILKRRNIPIAGQEAVVVGRSDIVGKPVAMLLTNANATVTICHSKTRDLPGVCRRADILVAAIGRAGMITRDFVRPGATVIDVGMNQVTDRAEFDRLFAGNAKRAETFRDQGIHARRRRPSSCRRSCRGPDSGSRRRRAADHCHADGEYGEGSQTAPRQPHAGDVAGMSRAFHYGSINHGETEAQRVSFSWSSRCLCVSVVNSTFCVRLGC